MFPLEDLMEGDETIDVMAVQMATNQEVLGRSQELVKAFKHPFRSLRSIGIIHCLHLLTRLLLVVVVFVWIQNGMLSILTQSFFPELEMVKPLISSGRQLDQNGRMQVNFDLIKGHTPAIRNGHWAKMVGMGLWWSMGRYGWGAGRCGCWAFELWNLPGSGVHKSMRSIYIYYLYYRRKFRSQTSNNMDRWKAEQGRGREKGKD